MSDSYPIGWAQLSRQLRDAADGQCEACWVRGGQKPKARRLAVDHADGNTWNLRRNNLTVLCARCHMIKGNLSRVRLFVNKQEVIEALQRRFDRERSQRCLTCR
jgi:hypothetical protein